MKCIRNICILTALGSHSNCLYYLTVYPKKYAHGFCYAVLCCGYLLTDFPYPSGLLHWHSGNRTIAPVPAKQPWWIWINTSCEFIMNDCITTTKQSTTKPCAYFLGYTVQHIRFWMRYTWNMQESFRVYSKQICKIPTTFQQIFNFLKFPPRCGSNFEIIYILFVSIWFLSIWYKCDGCFCVSCYFWWI